MEGIAAVAQAIAVMGATLVVSAIVIWILTIVAWWKIFTKAGEAGWKSLIPIYSGHVLARICWKPMYFWLSFFLMPIGTALSTHGEHLLLSLIGAAMMLAASLILFIQNFKLSKAFGHGVGFGIGLWLLHTLFALILGLGRSGYVGNPHREN